MKNNFKKNIINKINNGNIKMKPRIYFTAKIISILTIVTITIVVLSFLASFSVFSIKESSRLFLLGFGSAGIWTFFLTFPWLLLFIEIILIIITDVLLRNFKFAYRTPFLYILLATSIFVTFGSILMSYTPIHETLYQEATEQKLPFLKTMYINAKHPPTKLGVYRGIVIAIDDDALTIYSDDKDKDEDDGNKQTVFIPKDKLNDISSKIKIGDLVITACNQENNERCYVYGIKKLKMK